MAFPYAIAQGEFKLVREPDLGLSPRAEREMTACARVGFEAGVVLGSVDEEMKRAKKGLRVESSIENAIVAAQTDLYLFAWKAKIAAWISASI